MVKFKITVGNSNLAQKINSIHAGILKRSFRRRRIKNLMERKLWILDFLFVLYFIYLTFFEKPYWCDKMGEKMLNDCAYDIYGNHYNLLFYFSYHSQYVFSFSVFIMCYFNIKFYITYSNLRKNTSLFQSNRKIRLVFASVLNIFHVLFYFMAKDDIISIDGCSLIKTFFLFLMIDFLYVNFTKVLKYFFNFYEVFIFFLIDWMFIAALIEVLFVAFPTYYDHKEYYSFNFNNYFKSLFSVFVFFTGNNSPEMIIKNYPSNSFITMMFMGIIWINNILMIGLLIGLSYYKMKQSMSQEIEKVYQDEHKQAVFEKLLLYPDAKRNLIRTFLKMHMDNDVKPYISIEQLAKQQNSKNNTITRASEFIFDLLKNMKSYEFFYSLLNIYIAFYALMVIQQKDFEKYQQFLYMILLCAVSLMDFLHNQLFADVTNLDKSWRTSLDALLSLTIIILSLILFVDHSNNTILKVWGFASIAKCFRFFVFYFRFDRKKLRSNIIYPVAKFIMDISMQIFVVYVIFSSLGLNLFGGNINSFSLDLYNEDMGTDLDYEKLNFNTFVNSFIFLFVVSLNNNWPILANLCIINHGKGERRMMKFIFVFFKFFINFILLNSIIGFVIEVFYDYERKINLEIPQRNLNSEDEDDNDVSDYDERDELSGMMDNNILNDLDKQNQTQNYQYFLLLYYFLFFQGF